MMMLETLRMWVNPTLGIFDEAREKRRAELERREKLAEAAASAGAERIRDVTLALKRSSEPPTESKLSGYRTLARELKSADNLMQRAFDDDGHQEENSSGPESSD